MDAHETHEALELHTPPATPSDAMPGALQSAAAAGNVPALLALLAQGAQVNAAGEGGWTPLMFAAACGQPQALQALLAAGADACLMNREEETARSIAKTILKRPATRTPRPLPAARRKRAAKPLRAFCATPLLLIQILPCCWRQKMVIWRNSNACCARALRPMVRGRGAADTAHCCLLQKIGIFPCCACCWRRART